MKEFMRELASQTRDSVVAEINPPLWLEKMRSGLNKSYTKAIDSIEFISKVVFRKRTGEKMRKTSVVGRSRAFNNMLELQMFDDVLVSLEKQIETLSNIDKRVPHKHTEVLTEAEDKGENIDDILDGIESKLRIISKVVSDSMGGVRTKAKISATDLENVESSIMREIANTLSSVETSLKENLVPKILQEMAAESEEAASKIVLETLEVNPNAGMENFSSQLCNAVKSLPQYKKIESELSDTPKEQLPYEVFKLLKRAADAPLPEGELDKLPKDGVLVKSMRQGVLECAGRALIASIFFQEHGVDHSLLTAPGHSMIMIDLDQESAAYFDANNNLYFTLPKKSIAGYKGPNKVAECRISSFSPSPSDVRDGLNSVFTHFISQPPSEGVGRQYLSSVEAALNGNKEFATSGIQTDKRLAKSVPSLEKKIFGKRDRRLENFEEASGHNIRWIERESKADQQTVLELFHKYSSEDDFAKMFAAIVEGQLGDRFPYIKNAPLEDRIKYGRELWRLVNQSQATDKTGLAQKPVEQKDARQNLSEDIRNNFRRWRTLNLPKNGADRSRGSVNEDVFRHQKEVAELDQELEPIAERLLSLAPESTKRFAETAVSGKLSLTLQQIRKYLVVEEKIKDPGYFGFSSMDDAARKLRGLQKAWRGILELNVTYRPATEDWYVRVNYSI